MDEFFRGMWDFAGSYWWLVFPLMGVAGGIGKSWERASKRRHERRLETLRLKGELKAAQLAARGGAPHQARQSARQAAADERASTRQLLERLFAEHDEVTARWLDYELDVAKLIAFPAMSDGRQPLTAAFLRAKKIADALRPASADAKLSEAEIAEYVDATQAERNLAYKRVREELDGLILLSDEAVDVLEQKVAGQLGPARASGAAPAPSPEPQKMPLPREEPQA
jgi:hypothetical protein